MGLDTRSAIPHPRRSQIAPKQVYRAEADGIREGWTANYRSSLRLSPVKRKARTRQRRLKFFVAPAIDQS